MKYRQALFFLAPLCLAGCASSGVINGIDEIAERTPAERLVARMEGRFASLPAEKDAGQDTVPVQDFRKRLAPLGEGEWVYFQRNQGVENRVYRQRVLQFLTLADGRVSQITWSLKMPEEFGTAPGNPALLSGISKASLVPTLAKGCEQNWRFIIPASRGGEDKSFWNGRVDPAKCIIFSKRRNKRIAIGSETRLTRDALYEAERGFDLDGTQLWGTPMGQFSRMDRMVE